MVNEDLQYFWLLVYLLFMAIQLQSVLIKLPNNILMDKNGKRNFSQNEKIGFLLPRKLQTNIVA